MHVWVYVEGESDRIALGALWANWRAALRDKGHGLGILPLQDKSRFLRKIGHRAAATLVDYTHDLVVGLPDLYPNQPYEHTAHAHADVEQLRQVQVAQVRRALKDNHKVGDAGSHLERFHASALKHDLEMLLLAARDELRAYLGTTEQLGVWRNPVEEQDQAHPPKRVVEDLFLTKSRRRKAYRDTKDARAILEKVSDVRTVLFAQAGQLQCPVFKEMLDWIGGKTDVPCYA